MTDSTNDNQEYINPFSLTKRDKWLIAVFFIAMIVLGGWFGMWGYDDARLWAESRMK